MKSEEVWQELQKMGVERAIVFYSGGHDEGGVDVINLFNVDGKKIGELNNHSQLENALSDPVYEKYGSFAGEYYVNGTLTFIVSEKKLSFRRIGTKPTKGEFMANPYHHSLSSVKKWGGVVEDYIEIHNWFDASKEMFADFRHRALRHHAQGIFESERVFGNTITNSDGRVIPVRWIGEQHVQEDCGFIPSIQDWFIQITPQPWMNKPMRLSVSLQKEIV